MILRCLGFGAIFFVKKNKDFISVRRGGMVRGGSPFMKNPMLPYVTYDMYGTS